MKTIYHGHSNKSGIYQIKNLVNQKVYIGSSKEFKRRYTQHLNTLKKGTHHNKHLQASFNKHGSDNFTFEVLEVTEGTTEERLLKEQEYINRLIKLDQWEDTFNFQKISVQKERKVWSSSPEKTKAILSAKTKEYYKTHPHPKKGVKLTKEQKLLRSKQRKQYYIDNPEFAMTSTEAMRKHKETEEQKAARVAATKAFYEANPDRELFNGERPVWTEERIKSISGKGNHFYGKKHTEESKRKISEANRRTQKRAMKWVFIDPQGNEITIINLKRYCLEHNLSNALMQRLSYGNRTKSGQYNGYKFVSKTQDIS